eukprot:TRINITY_DN25177_c0_g1_i1.p1 TRINITY_DN25177_c0_g1~~TRINITY_DN25177_c0_g1_i1.p1  ORF type:complete len:665 (+),score=165.69 TRINITY_DN25177_c0_g1_i1:62-2056(+)
MASWGQDWGYYRRWRPSWQPSFEQAWPWQPYGYKQKPFLSWKAPAPKKGVEATKKPAVQEKTPPPAEVKEEPVSAFIPPAVQPSVEAKTSVKSQAVQPAGTGRLGRWGPRKHVEAAAPSEDPSLKQIQQGLKEILHEFQRKACLVIDIDEAELADSTTAASSSHTPDSTSSPVSYSRDHLLRVWEQSEVGKQSQAAAKERAKSRLWPQFYQYPDAHHLKTWRSFAAGAKPQGWPAWEGRPAPAGRIRPSSRGKQLNPEAATFTPFSWDWEGSTPEGFPIELLIYPATALGWDFPMMAGVVDPSVFESFAAGTALSQKEVSKEKTDDEKKEEQQLKTAKAEDEERRQKDVGKVESKAEVKKKRSDAPIEVKDKESKEPPTAEEGELPAAVLTQEQLAQLYMPQVPYPWFFAPPVAEAASLQQPGWHLPTVWDVGQVEKRIMEESDKDQEKKGEVEEEQPEKATSSKEEKKEKSVTAEDSKKTVEAVPEGQEVLTFPAAPPWLLLPGTSTEAVIEAPDPWQHFRELQARRQIEYYFSLTNLCYDVFLRSRMDEDGWVRLAEILEFPRMQRLGLDVMNVAKSLTGSNTVEVSLVEPVQVRLSSVVHRDAFKRLGLTVGTPVPTSSTGRKGGQEREAVPKPRSRPRDRVRQGGKGRGARGGWGGRSYR